MIDLEPFWITLKLAVCTTTLLFLISVPIAYRLAHTQKRYKSAIEAVVSLPLVLPPTVLGFYFLLAFSPTNGIGKFLENYFHFRLVFSFTGLVIASLFYSLPFMVHPIQSGFASLSPNLREAAYSLGKSKWETLVKVLLPNIKPSILTGIVLSFAHTIGEFGVVLMIGGNIPGQTKVVSIAIFDEVESMNYHNANIYAITLFIITFFILVTVYSFNNKYAITKQI